MDRNRIARRGGLLLVCAMLVTSGLAAGGVGASNDVSTDRAEPADLERRSSVGAAGDRVGRERAIRARSGPPPRDLVDFGYNDNHPFSKQSWSKLQWNGLNGYELAAVFGRDQEPLFCALFGGCSSPSPTSDSPVADNRMRQTNRVYDPERERPFNATHQWNYRQTDDVGFDDDNVKLPKRLNKFPPSDGSGNCCQAPIYSGHGDEFTSGTDKMIKKHYVTVHSVSPSTVLRHKPGNHRPHNIDGSEIDHLAPFEGRIQVITDYTFEDGGGNDKITKSQMGGGHNDDCHSSGLSIDEPDDDYDCKHWYEYETQTDKVEFIKVWARPPSGSWTKIAQKNNAGQFSSLDYSYHTEAEEVELRVRAKIKVKVKRKHKVKYCSAGTYTETHSCGMSCSYTHEHCSGYSTTTDHTKTFGPHTNTVTRTSSDPGMHRYEFYNVSDTDVSIEYRQMDPNNVPGGQRALDVKQELPKHWSYLAHEQAGFGKGVEILGRYEFYGSRWKKWDKLRTKTLDENGVQSNTVDKSPIRPAIQYAVPRQENPYGINFTATRQGLVANIDSTSGSNYNAPSVSNTKYPNVSEASGSYTQPETVEYRMTTPLTDDQSYTVYGMFPKEFDGHEYDRTENLKLRGVQFQTTQISSGGPSTPTTLRVEVVDPVSGNPITDMGSRPATVTVTGDTTQTLSFSGSTATFSVPNDVGVISYHLATDYSAWRNPETGTYVPIYRHGASDNYAVSINIGTPNQLIAELLIWLTYIYLLWLVSLYAYNHIWPPADHDRSFP